MGLSLGEPLRQGEFKPLPKEAYVVICDPGASTRFEPTLGVANIQVPAAPPELAPLCLHQPADQISV